MRLSSCLLPGSKQVAAAALKASGCAASLAGASARRSGIIPREQEMLRQPDGFLSMTVRAKV